MQFPQNRGVARKALALIAGLLRKSKAPSRFTVEASSSPLYCAALLVNLAERLFQLGYPFFDIFERVRVTHYQRDFKIGSKLRFDFFAGHLRSLPQKVGLYVR
jgi:hypothetical protein